MSTDRALEAARRIVAWQEVAGDGPADAWPTTCGDAVDVARALLALSAEVERLKDVVSSLPVMLALAAKLHPDSPINWGQFERDVLDVLPTPPSSQPGNSEATR